MTAATQPIAARIRVLKFGGTSLLSGAEHRLAVERVRAALDHGVSPIVVVSAFGRRGAHSTDTLFDLARQLYPNASQRELALLGSCGETIACAVFACALAHYGVPAVGLTGPDAGLRTTGAYVESDVVMVDKRRLLRELRHGRVPVVAGYQGRSPRGDLALLKRGGSDVTAASVAVHCGAEAVEVYTDVPGVMTADPWLVPSADLIDYLAYEDALWYAEHGAKVVHPDAIRWATRAGLPITVCTTASARCTTIGPGAASGTPFGVTVAALDDARAEVAVVGTGGNGVASVVRHTLREAHVDAAVHAEHRAVVARVSASDAPLAARLLHARLVTGAFAHDAEPLATYG